MKIIVDRLPESPRDCCFGSNSTGKYRCKFDAHLCPIVRDGSCPYLADTRDRSELTEIAPDPVKNAPDPNQVYDKKPSRSRKKAQQSSK